MTDALLILLIFCAAAITVQQIRFNGTTIEVTRVQGKRLDAMQEQLNKLREKVEP